MTRTATPPPDDGHDQPAEAEKLGRFRFKSNSHRSSHREEREPNNRRDERAGQRHDRLSSRRHHHRHKRRPPRSPSHTLPPPTGPEIHKKARGNDTELDTDAAFRESLFDALADDEGAAYWEGVYGQPIHIYSRPSSHDPENPKGRQGNQEEDEESAAVQRMTDDEYAAYVRQKMWEKTHAGLLEERARRAKERAAREKEADESRKSEYQQRKAADKAGRVAADMERSLRRGEERRAERAWRYGWDQYLARWKIWDGSIEGIAWPVRSGLRHDIGAEEVRTFFSKGLELEEAGEEKDPAARLREDRVRWHPDKMQQRLGGLGAQVDASVMRDVTAVFQIIDQLWADTRPKM